MTEISREINRQVGVLVDRKGNVEWVFVGDARRIVLPDFKRVRAAERRFRGLRCIHTHLSSEPLTRDDLTDLALLRLDLMASIDVTKEGLPGKVRAAYLSPADGNGGNLGAGAWEYLEPQSPSQLDLDFLEFIEALEGEFADKAGRASTHFDGRDRAILVGVTTGSAEAERESLEELAELARSSDVVVLDSIVQKRPKLDPRTSSARARSKTWSSPVCSTAPTSSSSTRTSLPPRCARSPKQPISRSSTALSSSSTSFPVAPRAAKASSRSSWLSFDISCRASSGPARRCPASWVVSVVEDPARPSSRSDRRRARERIARLEREIEHIRRKRGVRRKRRVESATSHRLPGRLHECGQIDTAEPSHPERGRGRQPHVRDPRPNEPASPCAGRARSPAGRHRGLHT